jgi:hypothetical protein
MKLFKQHHSILLEFFDAIDGAVKHIDHLEENILNKGKQGVIEAINQIESSISYFVDESDYKISTKFDGAPAIVAGVDTNGKFFVASKSAFAKNPKINYTDQDIIDNHGNGGLADKLKHALRYLPSLNLKGIYQMDYMFDPQMKAYETPETIDGVKNENRFLTFTPNTIKYAVHDNSPYGDQIAKSKIGVAVHIEYMVQNGILKVKKYTSSPDEFTPSNTVFVFNVLADKPKNAKSAFSKLLLKDVQKKKNQLIKLADRVNFSALDDHTVTLKSYINSEIKAGRFLDDTTISTEEYVNYISNRFVKAIEKLKSEKGKAKKTDLMKKTLSDLKMLKPSIKRAFEITKIIANLKNNLIKIFNEITRNDVLGTYLEETPNNWQTTAPEGFALSKVSDSGAQITKLVDREEFSRANFGTGKPTTPPPPLDISTENAISFNTLYALVNEDVNQRSKPAVFAFGRMNPPTIGHQKLVDKIKSINGDHFVFLSHTKKPKTDPLSFEQKIAYARDLFTDINVGDETVRTPVQSLQKLQELGYTDVIFVAGSDRVAGFQKLFDTYNGKPDKSGTVPFSFDTIQVVSAGERDPDADGAEGMSASKMRQAAVEDDYASFKLGVPDPAIADEMYAAVRSGMKLS